MSIREAELDSSQLQQQNRWTIERLPSVDHSNIKMSFNVP